MEEEVALERASQLAIKYLLREPAFLELWEQKVAEQLERHQSAAPSTSCHGISSLQTAVGELTATIEFVVTTFEENVDPRNCVLCIESTSSNRDASALFEAGLKVEKLTNTAVREAGVDTIAVQIGAACRRLVQVLKAYGKKFQSQNSVDTRASLSFANRLCRLFYTISREISKLANEFSDVNERKIVRNLGRKLREVSDEFNVKVMAELERIEQEEEKREKSKKPYGVKTRSQKKLVTSIQEAVREAEEVDRGMYSRRTHPPGSIATSIVSKRKGFLIKDSLAKARERVQRVPHIPRKHEASTDVKEHEPGGLEEDDYDVMASARAMTGMVIAEMRQTMRLGNDEHLLIFEQ
ncbi:unnamed protein product [Caenorhabditis sp. 36 PRJEB53466]|nr:unnamed protein product [Caenorhabditis sp. 36 PRJEB53466]